MEYGSGYGKAGSAEVSVDSKMVAEILRKTTAVMIVS